MTETVYMEMCSRNIGKRIKKEVGFEKVMIFDIDQCLYHAPDLEVYEHNSIRDAFISLTQRTEADWNEYMSSHFLFREIFHVILGVHPREFCDTYEDHHPIQFISKDEELIEILGSIRIRKFCFTNGTAVRAKKILQHMGIEELFEAVICNDIEETEFICKPKPSAFKFVEEFLGIKNRKNIYFFDDSTRNINSAKEYGWNAILVENNLKNLMKEHSQ